MRLLLLSPLMRWRHHCSSIFSFPASHKVEDTISPSLLPFLSARLDGNAKAPSLTTHPYQKIEDNSLPPPCHISISKGENTTTLSWCSWTLKVCYSASTPHHTEPHERSTDLSIHALSPYLYFHLRRGSPASLPDRHSRCESCSP